NNINDNFIIEVKMEEGNKHCYSCRYYKPYYTKGYIKFDRCDIGLCTRKEETVEKHKICENYYRMYNIRLNRRQAALSAIAEHINVLAELKQVLEEDDAEAIKELFLEFKNRKR
ncbi:MAG: hypothetical protein K2L12_01725, partial [Clostridia bacterium]|nr:hypothetical protein [Clostridia bacterium]